ncbi:MAG: DUF4136 domain-containing protein [Sphingomonadales bacterium]
MSRLTQIVTVLAVSLFLAGCASQFRSDVARFHMLPAPSGETFVVEPFDPAKAGSIEFAQYARQIAGYLSSYGYRPASATDNAQLIVKVDYGVDDGRTMVRSYGSSYAGFHSHYYRHYYWPYYYQPYYGGFYPDPFYSPEIRSYTVYTRQLSMDIQRVSGERLFEGRVESDGRDNRLPEVMPYLIRAMFTDFPGRSGATETVTLDEADGSGY